MCEYGGGVVPRKWAALAAVMAVVARLALPELSSVHPPFFYVQLLCLIGESFAEHGPEVCGAVINIRTKWDKIALWTKEAENQDGVLHIG